MTSAGERLFQVLAGVRRARELLVSREPVFMASHASFPGDMLVSAGADLQEIVRIATAMHRACVVGEGEGSWSGVVGATRSAGEPGHAA